MHLLSGKLNVKIAVILLFVGFLALPIYLERLSGKPDKSLEDTDQGRGNKRFGFSLEEVSKQIGIKFILQSPLLDPDLSHILPQIASMGASVSICDVNNDGWNDLWHLGKTTILTESFEYAQNGGRNWLFENRGNGFTSPSPMWPALSHLPS